MNHPEFTQLRRLIDRAITFNDLNQARMFAKQGFDLAKKKEILGEEMYFRAQFEIIDENFNEGIKFLDKAIEYNPKDGAAYNDRALCMIELGRIDGVMDYFDKGIEVEPDYENIYHNKGWFLNKIGCHEQALEFFNKALVIDPDRAVTYENIANVYENMGKTTEAINAYRSALRLLGPKYNFIKGQVELEIKRLEEIKCHE